MMFWQFNQPEKILGPFWPTGAPSRPSTCSYCFQLLEGLLAGDALSEAVRLGGPLLPRCQLPGHRKCQRIETSGAPITKRSTGLCQLRN